MRVSVPESVLAVSFDMTSPLSRMNRRTEVVEVTALYRRSLASTC